MWLMLLLLLGVCCAGETSLYKHKQGQSVSRNRKSAPSAYILQGMPSQLCGSPSPLGIFLTVPSNSVMQGCPHDLGGTVCPSAKWPQSAKPSELWTHLAFLPLFRHQPVAFATAPPMLVRVSNIPHLENKTPS